MTAGWLIRRSIRRFLVRFMPLLTGKKENSIMMAAREALVRSNCLYERKKITMKKLLSLFLCGMLLCSFAAAENELVDNFMIYFTEEDEWDESLQAMAETFGIRDIPMTSVSATILTIQEDDYVIQITEVACDELHAAVSANFQVTREGCIARPWEAQDKYTEFFTPYEYYQCPVYYYDLYVRTSDETMQGTFGVKMSDDEKTVYRFECGDQPKNALNAAQDGYIPVEFGVTVIRLENGELTETMKVFTLLCPMNAWLQYLPERD